MLENNPVQESLSKAERSVAGLQTRPPLQNLNYENIPQPILSQPSNPQLGKLYFSEIFAFYAFNGRQLSNQKRLFPASV